MLKDIDPLGLCGEQCGASGQGNAGADDAGHVDADNEAASEGPQQRAARLANDRFAEKEGFVDGVLAAHEVPIDATRAEKIAARDAAREACGERCTSQAEKYNEAFEEGLYHVHGQQAFGMVIGGGGYGRHGAGPRKGTGTAKPPPRAVPKPASGAKPGEKPNPSKAAPDTSTPKAEPSQAAGARRAATHGEKWSRASLSDAKRKFAGDSPNVRTTESGKRIYENPDTGIQVVEDIEGGYFRIMDPSLGGKRKYLDLDGNIPNNKVLPGGKQAGRSQGEYNEVTHFKIDESR